MKDVYERLYQGSAYREFSPGETRVEDFKQRVKTTADDVILDIGCGTGRATKALSKSCKTIGLDFVNALETEVEFCQHDLRKEFPVNGTVGFCCDVMEHIHPRDVSKVLRNIMRAVDKCYLQICTVPDQLGEGNVLHLTIKPFWWWAKQLHKFGIVRYARQERMHAIFVLQRSINMRELEKRMLLMEPVETLHGYVKANLEAGYEEAAPFQVQGTEVAILAGGPSLKEFNGFDGPIITVNGAYNWAVERGFKPKAQIIVDPREWNKRFTQPVVPGCKYLIASQCNPEILKSVPKEQVWLWHSGDLAAPVLREWGETHGPRDWMAIFGGSTVMLRGLPLLCMLGLRKFHIWGFDSCLDGNQHHAYSQPENDLEKVIEISVGGRKFNCHTWMAVQAQEYMDLVKHMLPEDVEMIVYGDGLISHILKTGAIYGGSSLEGLQRGEEIHPDGRDRPRYERRGDGALQGVV